MFRPVLSTSEIAVELSKKLETTISRVYISNVMREMDEHATIDLAQKTSLDLATEARRTYQRLEEEGFQMHIRASQIIDPVERSKVEARALNQVRNAREAQDRMYKYMGITAETFRLEHVDITQTEGWKSFMKGLLIYQRHVLTCPDCGHQGFDVKPFITFIENVKNDPMYIEQFFSAAQRSRQASRDGYGDIVLEEAEFDDIGGEPETQDAQPGDYETTGPSPDQEREHNNQEQQDGDGEGEG